MLDEWIEWIRVVNLSFALISFIHLLRYYRVQRSRMSRSNQDQWVIWTVISGGLVFLIVDAIRRDAPVTIGTFINTIIVGTLVYGIFVRKLWSLKEDEYEELQ